MQDFIDRNNVKKKEIIAFRFLNKLLTLMIKDKLFMNKNKFKHKYKPDR